MSRRVYCTCRVIETMIIAETPRWPATTSDTARAINVPLAVAFVAHRSNTRASKRAEVPSNTPIGEVQLQLRRGGLTGGDR